MKVNGVWTELEIECHKKERSVLDGNNFQMRHLNAETYYRIELRAHNAIGMSEPVTLLLKTARGESRGSYGTFVYRAGYMAANSEVPKVHSLLFYCLCSIYYLLVHHHRF